MRTPVPKSIPIIQRRLGIACCPSLTTFMTPSSSQRTAARDQGRPLERAEYAQMPSPQPVIFQRAGPMLCGMGSTSANVESIGLPADAPSIVAQNDSNCDRTGPRRRLPPVVARDLSVGPGAAGCIRIERAASGKPGDRDPFALIDETPGLRVED